MATPPADASTISENDHKTILAKSATGAKLLIILQVGSRAVTFAANQLLLGFISPDSLGIAAQLEVYSISVLYFARESLRLAIQRQNDAQDDVSADTRGNAAATKSERKLLAKNKTQAIVNIAYISIILGIIFALALGKFYVGSQSSNISVTKTPYFQETVQIYGLAAILELFAEPCFVVVQQKSEYKIRAAAESTGTVVRCLLTSGFMILAAENGVDIGVLPFAIGQLAYGMSVLCVYYWRVLAIAETCGFSLRPKAILSTNASYALSFFSTPLLTLAISLFIQGFVKHVLTQGDVIIISMLASLPAQGMYALASNYGGLVARMLFQPMEESSRNYFGKLLSDIEGKPSAKKVKSARDDLTKLLHVYSLLSICAVAVGPPVAPVLLRLVVGSRWSASGAGHLLSKYCYYIPLLAFNGVLESFVSVVATKSQLNRQSFWMLGFSVAFACTAFLFLSYLDMGADGLVYANMANMAFRITWCSSFISSYLESFSLNISMSDIMPNGTTLAAAAAAIAVFQQLSRYRFTSSWQELIVLGSISCIFVLLLTVSERRFLKQCYQSTQTPKRST